MKSKVLTVLETMDYDMVEVITKDPHIPITTETIEQKTFNKKHAPAHLYFEVDKS